MGVLNIKASVALPDDRIFGILPEIYSLAYYSLTEYQRQHLSEIRIRSGKPSSFTVSGLNLPVKYAGRTVKACSDEIAEILERACGGSLYAYSDTIGKGYISCLGTRIGVTGYAYSSDAAAASFAGITSLNIRLPRYVPSADDGMCSYIRRAGFENTFGILAVSPPNCGKTTFLRSLARDISAADGEFVKRVCVADERGELDIGNVFDGCLCDVITGVPKALCAEIAARTMSAQVLIFDEIGNAAEAEQLLAASFCGVYIAASVHGTSLADALKKKHIARLVKNGVFRTAYVLRRSNDTISGNICPVSEGDVT